MKKAARKLFLLLLIIFNFSFSFAQDDATPTEDATLTNDTTPVGDVTPVALDNSTTTKNSDKVKPNKEKESTKKKSKNDNTPSNKNSQTVITIINAMKSSNKKDAVTNDDVIEFSGNVKVSVEKNGSTTTISADKITYNRARDMLFAEGAVVLEQTEKNGSTQNVTSDILLFNTSTLEGIFDNAKVIQAQSNAINLPSGSTLNVSSDLFTRDDSGTIAFKTGELTFCNDENPHWKIKASRIWLLPGNEFAFLNALLFVGKVPVLYLPAFYYPKDELIFNPVFGYRNRQGYYFQTSTYLLGRKPLDTNSSSEEKKDINADYFNLVRPTKLMDQELQGLVLHNLDTEYKGDTSNYLKLIADYYSNLGFLVGLDGAFKPKKYVDQISASLILGWSNTVFQNPNTIFYEPFDVEGKRYQDHSSFLGLSLPFRYKGGFAISGNTPFSYSLSLPFYSDPFFDYDFGNRKETMDWFSYLLNNPTSETTDTTEQEKLDASEIKTFSWDLTLSYNAPLNDIIKPYINNISINSFNSNIVFDEVVSKKEINGSQKIFTEINDSNGWYMATPERKFFYPSSITPLKFSTMISGTIFSTNEPKKKKQQKNQDIAVTLSDIPWLKSKEESKNKNTTSNKDNPPNKNDNEDIKTVTLNPELFYENLLEPDLNFNVPSISSSNGFTYQLGYSLEPAFTSQISYASEPLFSSSDFRWDRLKSSYIQVHTPLEFSQTLGYKNNFIGMTNSITLDPLYQTHPYISENAQDGGYTNAQKKSLISADYAATYMDIINSNRIELKPFVYYPNFKDTGIAWNSSLKLMRTKFVGDADNPSWDVLTVDWTDRDSITTNTLDTKLAATQGEGRFGESLIYTTTMPPQLQKHYFTFNAFVPHFSTTLETGFSKDSQNLNIWKKEQLRQGATLSFFNDKLKISESFNYDLEGNYSDAFKASISYKDFQVAYTAKYTDIYDFDQNRGWVTKNEKKFVPYSFSFAYATSSYKYKAWKNRIEFAPGLNTSLVIDFVRPTNSYFVFSPAISFRINNFLTFNFSSTTRNDSIYRYVQNAVGHHGRIPGEENIFMDLINSFRFDNEELRKGSGFKLKSLQFTLTHDLHDWDLKSEFKLEPRLVTENGRKKYDFSPYFSISVVWRPMESIKTQIVDKYGTVLLNEE